jgi:uncharacterized phage protein gp47/JayE
MSFLKDFDTILNEILTSYQNQLPDVDRSPGTMVFIKSACLASALWGLYKYQDYISRQIFPDTADTVFLEKHCARRGLTRIAGETDSELLSRLLAVLQNPPAGGTKADYETWAKEVSYTHDAGQVTEWVENVKTAICFPNARGVGSVNVAITSDRTESGFEEIPTSELIAAVTANIEAKRVVTGYDFSVYAAAHNSPTVTLLVSGVDANTLALISDDIEAFMRSLPIGKTLYLAQIESLAIVRGAETVTVVNPSADVTALAGPTSYQRIWPDTVEVSAA